MKSTRNLFCCALSLLLAVALSSCSYSNNVSVASEASEEYAFSCVENVIFWMTDPDSFVLNDDVIIITDNNYNTRYAYINYSGSSRYTGGQVGGIAMFLNDEDLGCYDSNMTEVGASISDVKRAMACVIYAQYERNILDNNYIVEKVSVENILNQLNVK